MRGAQSFNTFFYHLLIFGVDCKIVKLLLTAWWSSTAWKDNEGMPRLFDLPQRTRPTRELPLHDLQPHSSQFHRFLAVDGAQRTVRETTAEKKYKKTWKLWKRYGSKINNKQQLRGSLLGRLWCVVAKLISYTSRFEVVSCVIFFLLTSHLASNIWYAIVFSWILWKACKFSLTWSHLLRILPRNLWNKCRCDER